MFCKDTPNLNEELFRWLIAYSLIGGNKKTETIYEKIINFAEINSSEFRDIIDEMIINGHIIKETKTIYAPKPGGKNVLEATNQHLYSLTQEGKKQMCLGWEFAVSAIPKELYNEALENIRLMYLSITPPFI